MRASCSVESATIVGVEAIPIRVEVAISNGIPGIYIVGMADTAVQEAKERVRSAIKASGFSMPNERIVINLAPSNIKKTGSGFDLPIAIGILAATHQIDPTSIVGKMFVGELSLSGNVRTVLGMLAYGICAKKLGDALISSGDRYLPVDGLEQRALRDLSSLHQEDPFGNVSQRPSDAEVQEVSSGKDFRDIAGHEMAKRAMQIAAAGNHALLMIGPPGSGKTMLASRMPSILPKLSQDEILEAAVVHSIVGEEIDGILKGERPFRQPHHSITSPGLLGGGSPIRPGEISLAHRGVLFLDELAEFKSSSLQGLRQPLESGHVNIIRADGNVRFPSDFTLIAASNPCPCGYLGDDDHECTCTDVQISKYMGRIGGPLIDRIEMQLDVRRLPSESVLDSGSGTDSVTLLEGVVRAREFSSWRRSRMIEVDGSSVCDLGSDHSDPRSIINSCSLEADSKRFITSLADSYKMSGRGLINTLKVARTIADMEESIKVGIDHLVEAVELRCRNAG